METKISFEVSGYVVQRIEILNNETPEEIAEKLNKYEYATTLHGNEPHITKVSDGTLIAKIINIDNNLTYIEFEAE